MRNAAIAVLLGFVRTRDSLIAVILRNMSLFVEAVILTFTDVLPPEAASVAVPYALATIRPFLRPLLQSATDCIGSIWEGIS